MLSKRSSIIQSEMACWLSRVALSNQILHAVQAEHHSSISDSLLSQQSNIVQSEMACCPRRVARVWICKDTKVNVECPSCGVHPNHLLTCVHVQLARYSTQGLLQLGPLGSTTFLPDTKCLVDEGRGRTPLLKRCDNVTRPSQRFWDFTQVRDKSHRNPESCNTLSGYIQLCLTHVV